MSLALAAVTVILSIPATALAGNGGLGGSVGTAATNSISAGKSNTCAILADTSLSCWGSNTAFESVPSAGTGFVKVSAGSYGGCAIKSTGALACWGDVYNLPGQPNPSTLSVKDVSVGRTHTCAVLTSGALACWGLDQGHVGQSTGDTNPPAGNDYASVSVGAFHSCALKVDGTITCWGGNWAGQANAPSGTYKQVAAGRTHTCALATNGSITCWGESGNGRTAAPTAAEFISISVGYAHGCAVNIDYRVRCWGDNSSGQATPLPTTESTGGFKEVAAGGNHTCVRTVFSKVYCWGSNSSGESAVPTRARVTKAVSKATSKYNKWSIRLVAAPALAPITKYQISTATPKPSSAASLTGAVDWVLSTQVLPEPSLLAVFSGYRPKWVRVLDTNGAWSPWFGFTKA